jgi:hypothetical protein
MLFGHNTNVTLDGTVFHVQTEDRGVNSATIDTTVHCRGRVLHRRTNKYHDLLPLDAEKEKSLKSRLDDQHFGVVDELKSGALKVEAPPMPPPRPAAPAASLYGFSSPAASSAVASASNSGSAPSEKVLSVEMLNPRTWLSGKHATLYVVTRHKDSGTPAVNALVVARIVGASDPIEVTTQSGEDGHAKLEFDMPRLGGEDPALIIDVATRDARGQLRFQLRAKPKTPAAG